MKGHPLKDSDVSFSVVGMTSQISNSKSLLKDDRVS